MGTARNVVNQNDNFWEMADPGIRRDYGEYFFSQTQVSIDYPLHAREILLKNNVDFTSLKRNYESLKIKAKHNSFCMPGLVTSSILNGGRYAFTARLGNFA